ncbi:MAG: hypothetical protein JWQ12_576 [Glaciihabitans sp.]|nr:hypothetical protein [Glaciihabitans sp.]
MSSTTASSRTRGRGGWESPGGILRCRRLRRPGRDRQAATSRPRRQGRDGKTATPGARKPGARYRSVRASPAYECRQRRQPAGHTGATGGNRREAPCSAVVCDGGTETPAPRPRGRDVRAVAPGPRHRGRGARTPALATGRCALHRLMNVVNDGNQPDTPERRAGIAGRHPAVPSFATDGPRRPGRDGRTATARPRRPGPRQEPQRSLPVGARVSGLWMSSTTATSRTRRRGGRESPGGIQRCRRLRRPGRGAGARHPHRDTQPAMPGPRHAHRHTRAAAPHRSPRYQSARV